MDIKHIYFPKQILILLLLAVILNIGRVLIFHSNYFIYLIWNIFLAVIPFILSSVLLWYANNKKLNKTLLIIGGVFWLLLIPNAPYIITDIIHLNHNHIPSLLYDTFLVFSSAWVGLLLGMYSISHIEKIIHIKYNNKTTSLIIAFIMLTTSFGMYLGRFMRFNSWDIFSNTSYFFTNIFRIILKPYNYVDAYLYTLLFFVFIYVSYKAWKYSLIEQKSNT
ncbi:MAG: DUF1361 domain-containing protein [Patescibacteria group bacterium]|nr:DUF1361 domain-containing protein [Patescibacteria group bacterium]